MDISAVRNDLKHDTLLELINCFKSCEKNNRRCMEVICYQVYKRAMQNLELTPSRRPPPTGDD